MQTRTHDVSARLDDETRRILSKIANRFEGNNSAALRYALRKTWELEQSMARQAAQRAPRPPIGG